MELALQSKIDFFRKRDEKERELNEAMARLDEHKKHTPESVFPGSLYDAQNVMYSFEYIRLLEAAIRAKTSLEVMDMVLENIMRERISILEKMLNN
jgi:hypothetical protein